MHLSYRASRIALIAAIGAMSAVALVLQARADTLAELAAAAKSEGSLNLYSAMPIRSVEHVAKAFQEKYGITVEFISLPAGTLMQRLATELESGSYNADAIVGAGFDGAVTEQFVPKGWFVPIRSAGIPAVDAGGYPDLFLNESTATLGYNPWTMAYNTDLVAEADAPKSFADLAEPKYKGALCTPNPDNAMAYIEVWDRILREYGDDLLARVRANEPKFYDSTTAAAAALAAGECAVAGPIVGPAVAALPPSAPVKDFIPPVTYGTQMELGYLNPEKTSHPNAAKLFAQYVLTPEGNEQHAIAGNNVWALNPAIAPEEIAKLKAAPDVADRKHRILELLGRK